MSDLKNPPLTLGDVEPLFHFDPATGRLYWKVARGNQAAGSVAGSRYKKGIRVNVNGHRYYVHHIVWLFATGTWPDREIDHRDGDNTNNRPNNLRLATPSQNNANRRAWGRHGVKGVRQHGKSFQARISINGHKIHLGTFKCKHEAHRVWFEKAQEIHGEFARAA